MITYGMFSSKKEVPHVERPYPFGENIRKESRNPERSDLLMPWRCLAKLDMTYFFGSLARHLAVIRRSNDGLLFLYLPRKVLGTRK